MTAMDWAHDLLLLLHLVGFAALFGGAFVQLRDREPVVNAAMLHGALTQLVSGLALVGVNEAGDVDVNHVKIGIKLVVTLLVTVLVVLNRRFDSIPKGLWAIILLLTLGNAALAVLW
ncbi:hypothetical protein [Desertihabitans brevis]|nr:hypothetical protein [Desertihabitans brevis]